MEIPDEASRALQILHARLGESLRAVYLHGSAASGGLRPNSDVDLMAIVERPTTPAGRRHLVDELLRLSGQYRAVPGGARPIELIVFRGVDLQAATYPLRSEFLYGEWLRAGFAAGGVPAPQPSPDFTLVVAQARDQAIDLFGPPATEVLPVVSATDIRRAIGDALPELLGNLQGDERNVLLTLARMWRTLATGQFVPKDVAAAWAARRLPPASAALLTLAAGAYLGTTADDWQFRQREARLLADDLGQQLRSMLAAST